MKGGVLDNDTMKQIRNVKISLISTAILAVLGIIFTSYVAVSVMAEKMTSLDEKLHVYILSHKDEHRVLQEKIIEKNVEIQGQLDKKVGVESFYEFKDALIRQLTRIESKIDNLEKTK